MDLRRSLESFNNVNVVLLWLNFTDPTLGPIFLPGLGIQ